MSLVDLELRNDHRSNVLSRYKYEQAPMKNNSESLDDCARYNNKEANMFGTLKEVRKFFACMGWYNGTVESSREQFSGSNTYTFRFEDGKYEEWSNEELAYINEESRISIGEVGSKVICKFGGAGYFNGEVTKIISRLKQECTFCDGEVSSYTLSQLTKYALAQQTPVIEDPSRDEEYCGGGGGIKSDDEARPKIPLVEEAPTVEECPTNEA